MKNVHRKRNKVIYGCLYCFQRINLSSVDGDTIRMFDEATEKYGNEMNEIQREPEKYREIQLLSSIVFKKIFIFHRHL